MDPNAQDRAVRAANLARIYQDTGRHWEAYDMCEKLVDVEENFQLWRFRHLKTVEQLVTIGTRTETMRFELEPKPPKAK